MTQKDKQLLLKDLCARLPYGVRIELTWWVRGEGKCINTTLKPDHIKLLLNIEDGAIEIEPYLRPMSSMTEEERTEYIKLNALVSIDGILVVDGENVDWLNAHHFDYRGLIEKGLVIEAPEGMYRKEDEK